MKSLFNCAMFVVGVAVAGCYGNAVKDPPVALTFRQGVLSRSVMQVSNLSTAEGLEVYVYVANAQRSLRSGNVVVQANSVKEFGALEINWEFKQGDRGFVRAFKYAKQLFFEVQENGHFKTWFGYDDIPEVDVAAQARVRQAAEHAAWLKGQRSICLVRGLNYLRSLRRWMPIGMPPALHLFGPGRRGRCGNAPRIALSDGRIDSRKRS